MGQDIINANLSAPRLDGSGPMYLCRAGIDALDMLRASKGPSGIVDH